MAKKKLTRIDIVLAYANRVKVALEGKKAYIVGCLMIALGIYTSDNVTTLEGLAVIAMRAGIAKGKK